MARYEIPVVWDTESDPPEPLGIYARTDEDVIFYRSPDCAGTERGAPADCVKIVTSVVKVP